MDLANTLLLCFIWAGLTCLHVIICQRLGIRAHGCKRLIHVLSQRQYYNEHLDVAAAAQPVVPVSPSTCHVPALGGAHGTMICNGNLNYVCSYISSSTCRLVDERGDMGSTCIPGAAPPAVKAAHTPTVIETATSGAFPVVQTGATMTDLQAVMSRAAFIARIAFILRPFMILDPGGSSGQRAACQGALLFHSRRQPVKVVARPRVTFQTGGAIICSAATVEVLGLMAAGTPPLPVTPASFASCCISGGVIAPAPIANADLAQAVCTMETDASISNASGCCPSSSFITSFAGNTPFLTVAPKSGQPVGGHVKQKYRLVSQLFWFTPPMAAFSSEGGLLCTD